MITNCELCCAEIEDYAVQKCPVCETDGLCPDCLDDHEKENGREVRTYESEGEMNAGEMTAEELIDKLIGAVAISQHGHIPDATLAEYALHAAQAQVELLTRLNAGGAGLEQVAREI